MEKYKFKEKLTEGIIESRPNRFIMMVTLNEKIFKCHCPSTGRIGNIEFKNIPCLVSKSENPERKTAYTVEAISLDPIKKKNKKWIGINQTKVNGYVEFFLRTGQLNRMIPKSDDIKREVTLGKSRIDFAVGNTYLEIKMPLISLPTKQDLKYEQPSKFNSFERLIKHYQELSKNLKGSSKAIVALCYLYNADPFIVPETNSDNKKIKHAVRSATNRGVENWQINLKINKSGISMICYFKLLLF